MQKTITCIGFLALCQMVAAFPRSNIYLVDPKLTLLSDADGKNIYLYGYNSQSDELESNDLFDPNDDSEVLYSSELTELQDAPSAPHRRLRRQLATHAMHLASDHSRAGGQDRPVGQVHGIFKPSGSGTLPNYSIGATAGLGSVVWRSPNRQHSLGIGATVDHSRGSSGGNSFQSPFNVNTGIGYRWRFR